MSATDPAGPSDRVLPATRVLSAVIIPFLVLAFLVLFFWPSAEDTGRLFAWKIAPGFTSMLLGSVYLGGSYFFLRAALVREWHRVGGGFVAVGTFATMMAIATVHHWDRFVHTNLAFWLWVLLYFTTPFLVFGVWLLNNRERTPARPDDQQLPKSAAVTIGVVGVAAVCSSLFLFLLPNMAVAIWPWSLTALTAKVVGAIFALGLIGMGAFWDRRWTSARILFQVAGFMLVLIAISVYRARADFDPTKVLTWVFAAGFVATAIAGGLLYAVMESRARTLSPAEPAPP